MKKLVILASTAMALNASTPTENDSSKLSGFYTGVQAGINTNQSTFHEVVWKKNRVKYGADSGIGGLFAGYGVGAGKNMYVGVEAYVNLVKNKTFFVDTPFFKASLKNNGNIGAKIRLSYTVSPQAMIFLGLGVEYSEWTLKNERKTPPEYMPGINQTTKTEKRNIAFCPSVGVDLYLNNHVFLRPEYTYVTKKNIQVEVMDLKYKSQTTQHRFTLGFGYKI